MYPTEPDTKPNGSLLPYPQAGLEVVLHFRGGQVLGGTIGYRPKEDEELPDMPTVATLSSVNGMSGVTKMCTLSWYEVVAVTVKGTLQDAINNREANRAAILELEAERARQSAATANYRAALLGRDPYTETQGREKNHGA